MAENISHIRHRFIGNHDKKVKDFSETEALKRHVLVNLNTGAIVKISDKPVIPPEKAALLRFPLGEGEYWQIEYAKNLWKGIIVPVIKSRGEKSPNKTLRATRPVIDKYGPILYRLRGIVESFIAFIFPHDNKAEAHKKDNARKILKLRVIAYNILPIATYQDMLFKSYR